jgi:hypothetical protein
MTVTLQPFRAKSLLPYQEENIELQIVRSEYTIRQIMVS